jgi:hypothetical protein
MPDDESPEPMEERRALPHFDSEEEFKNLPEFTLKDKYTYLKKKISDIIQEKESMETELAKAKIRWADIELAHDNIYLKLNHS